MSVDSENALAELGRRYAHWTMWLSDMGRYWAVTGDPSFLPGGPMRVTVDAGTLEELLAEQERLRGRDPYQDAVPQPRPTQDTA